MLFLLNLNLSPPLLGKWLEMSEIFLKTNTRSTILLIMLLFFFICNTIFYIWLNLKFLQPYHTSHYEKWFNLQFRENMWVDDPIRNNITP